MNKTVLEVTARIEERSKNTRKEYLDMIFSQEKAGRDRDSLTCSNIAHAAAGVSGNSGSGGS